jgi:hypothetical protein
MDDDDRYYRGPLGLEPLFLTAQLIDIAGSETARMLRKKYRELTRRKVGSTIRPGPETPLWNELARFAASQVGRTYGDKAALGRILGVPRQRVHEYLVANRACPDAERVLALLVWLSTRMEQRTAKGRNATHPRPRQS